MKRAISHLATMDCLFSLAEVAKQGDYCRWCPLMMTVNIGVCVCVRSVWVCICVCAYMWVSCVVSYSLRQAVCGSVHRAQQRAQPERQHLSHSLKHTLKLTHTFYIVHFYPFKCFPSIHLLVPSLFFAVFEYLIYCTCMFVFLFSERKQPFIVFVACVTWGLTNT